MAKRTFSMVFLIAAAALLCLHASAVDADAARFGGGKSFGGKSSYSRSAPAPRTAKQQDAYAGKQSQNPAAAARPGLAGSGFRGMLGGLLAGSMLGALLFGGAHSGLAFMDIVVIALAAFMALKLLRLFMVRRAAEEIVGEPSQRSIGEFALRTDPRSAPQTGSGGADSSGPDIRLEDFDADDFLRGAQMVYTRLQESWDKRDIDDIATFTTPAILSEVKAQAAAEPGQSTVEIMLINASLVSAVREGEEDVATVYFDVLLRENPEAQTPGNVRELWHFTRPADASETWRLDGIQQVE